MKSHNEIVGLIPAAGKAKRIEPLPCSKEIYPLGFRPVDQGRGLRPKVASHYLLEKMRFANVTKAYVILRDGKWDIPSYLGDGKMLNMNLAYLMMDLPFGVPYTLDQAYAFVKDPVVAFGFPDIIFQPEDAFVQLLARQSESNADIVLGLFPAHQPHKMDMVGLDAEGQICEILIKPVRTNFQYTWIIAVWVSSFTDFIHEYVLARQETKTRDNPGMSLKQDQELFLGDVIQAAIQKELQIDKVIFDDGNYLDIGTPEDMVRAVEMKM